MKMIDEKNAEIDKLQIYELEVAEMKANKLLDDDLEEDCDDEMNDNFGGLSTKNDFVNKTSNLNMNKASSVIKISKILNISLYFLFR